MAHLFEVGHCIRAGVLIWGNTAYPHQGRELKFQSGMGKGDKSQKSIKLNWNSREVKRGEGRGSNQKPSGQGWGRYILQEQEFQLLCEIIAFSFKQCFIVSKLWFKICLSSTFPEGQNYVIYLWSNLVTLSSLQLDCQRGLLLHILSFVWHNLLN